jgi:hypothetical protein
MSTASPPAFAIHEVSGPLSCKMPPSEVVEIGLLLPADWAVALVQLSKKRHQTVAQILRSLVERALIQADALP